MQPIAPPRWIAHLDMDAFYASVELLRHPELRGQPVVIGGRRVATTVPPPSSGERWARLRDYAGRGVVTTATYEARASGVRSGMGLMKAAALAPNAWLLPADFDEYRRWSRAFKAAVAELAPTIEDRGIDEIYIDLTELVARQETIGHDPLSGVKALAIDLKNNVRERTGLSCSIGVAPNKLLAKVCSDLDKPDGLTVLTQEDIAARIWPLPLRRLNGVGPKGGMRLENLGIHTLGDLARAPLASLIEQFGTARGTWLHRSAWGHDDRPVVTHSEPVSVSRETTFEQDLHPRTDREQLTIILERLCEQVSSDLARKGYRARTLGIKLRFDDFRTVTRDQTLPAATSEVADILAGARMCLKRVNFSRRMRLLGVRATSLEPVRSRSVAHALSPTPDSMKKRTRDMSPGRSKAERGGGDPHTLPLFGDEPTDEEGAGAALG